MMTEIKKYAQVPNWNHLRRRYLAFWNNEVVDDAIIAQIQNQGTPPPAEPWMTEASDEKYLNPKKLYKRKQWIWKAWDKHADLFFHFNPSFGPNEFIGFCGAKVVFGPDTVWQEPVISSVDEFDQITFDPDNHLWKAQLEIIDYAIKEKSDQALIDPPDFGGPSDWITAVMGAENCFIACIEQPEKVAAFALRLAEECCQAFDITYNMLLDINDGSVNWMPVWSDKCLGTVQDDMAINFSPEMYEEIFLPALRKIASHTEKTVLHWHDGCYQHIDLIVKEPAIDLIQFGHDPNTGDFKSHLKSMKKIQAAGKKLFISCVKAEDVGFFIGNLDPHGLMMIIDTDNNDSSLKMKEKVRILTQQRLAELS